MENNIFLKNKKDKFNPDVITNLSRKSNERKKNEFQISKNIYNPITNSVPDIIKSGKDLKLQKDNSIQTSDIRKLVKQKEDERNKQYNELKPLKIKSLPSNLIVDKHIENFEELKNNSESFVKKANQEQSQQKDKYNNIISGLQNLGIITTNKK
jgi:hypothetical protein